MEDMTVLTECTEEQEQSGLLQTIFEDGGFHNPITLTEIRERFDKLAGL